MNGAQLHLALNHIPVVLTMAATAVLIWGWFGKNPEIKKVGLILVFATAVFAGAAFLTGEPAEDVLEKLPVFPKELVHGHEEAGELSLVISILAGLSALATLYASKKNSRFFHRALIATTIIALLSSLAFVRTAHLGGLIRHEEIRGHP
ncbi:MAG: hypothetical protein JST80_03410 [Bdellovibrionales bacterium]|nr:hypothetical protein [Bdellovibrionales bacterium]